MGYRLPRALTRIVAAATALILLVPAAQAIESRQASSSTEPVRGSSGEGALALLDGEVIDLSEGWGGATTCVVVPDRLEYVECFRSDSARDQRLADLGLTDRFAEVDQLPEGAGFAAAVCSSYLKLYDRYYYGGASLWISSRGFWHNLSVYGFNQRTSSYRVGACSSIMADYSNGGGAWIPTSLTQAWDVDAVISGSWNNDVSSVYIY